jgi:hypothetical protein
VSGIRRKSHIGKSEFLRTRNSGHRKSRNPDEWGPAVVTAEKEDRGLVEASCQPTGVRDIGVFEDMERSQQEIAIRDFPTGSTPSISEDAWREIPESRSSAYRSFQSRETLTQWNRDTRFPDTIKAVHLRDRWQPSRTIGGWPHRHIGNRRIGDFKDTKPLHYETAICEFSTPS